MNNKAAILKIRICLFFGSQCTYIEITYTLVMFYIISSTQNFFSPKSLNLTNIVLRLFPRIRTFVPKFKLRNSINIESKMFVIREKLRQGAQESKGIKQ